MPHHVQPPLLGRRVQGRPAVMVHRVHVRPAVPREDLRDLRALTLRGGMERRPSPEIPRVDVDVALAFAHEETDGVGVPPVDRDPERRPTVRVRQVHVASARPERLEEVDGADPLLLRGSLDEGDGEGPLVAADGLVDDAGGRRSLHPSPVSRRGEDRAGEAAEEDSGGRGVAAPEGRGEVGRQGGTGESTASARGGFRAALTSVGVDAAPLVLVFVITTNTSPGTVHLSSWFAQTVSEFRLLFGL
mmetsp:Transcript_6413/g.18819  ORF Transcript_6413/g.18819 Transcript_6413/m.18819 type:complete len:246 (-) Transcript_6413:59-796(-)